MRTSLPFQILKTLDSLQVPCYTRVLTNESTKGRDQFEIQSIDFIDIMVSKKEPISLATGAAMRINI
jgi:hypothetical protein